MSEMVERAAKALCDEFAPTKRHPMYAEEEDADKEPYRARARAALLAALDPEDEALVEVVRKARDEAAWRGFDQATAIIRALRALAQGASVE